MRYHLKTDPMKPPDVERSKDKIYNTTHWHCRWGIESANTPEEAEIRFRNRAARTLGITRRMKVGSKSSYVSDAARRLSTNDFEVEEVNIPELTQGPYGH